MATLEQFHKRIEEELNKYPGVDYKGGTYECELYADYRDCLDDSDIHKILKADEPLHKFYSFIDEWYDPEAAEVFDSVANEIYETLCGDADAEFANKGLIVDDVYDYLQSIFWPACPYDHFLRQEVNINILVDTGDGNVDYTENTSIYPTWCADSDREPSDKASIIWLAKQQGYSKSEFWKAMLDDSECDSVFLKSARKELRNQSSAMGILAFMVRVTLEQAMTLKSLADSEGALILSKDTRVGLVDLWDGAGSILEIELERDVVLPWSLVRSALPDGMDGRYGIGNIYGVDDYLWEDGGIEEFEFKGEVL
jgi:hypothetical protein